MPIRHLLRLGLLPVLFLFPPVSSHGATTPRSAIAKAPHDLLTPVSFAAWKQVLASQRGHVVVVDFWATWCAPCVERFPRMVGLARRFEGRGVRFLSLSLDDRSDKEALAWARRFLSAQKSPFPNYLLDEPLGSGFDRLGLQGIPAVFLYGRSGTLRLRLTSDDPGDQVSEAKVKAAILRLLDEAGH